MSEDSNKVMIVIGLIAVVAAVVGGVVYMNNPSTGEQPAQGVEAPAEKITPLCTALKGYACAVARQEAAYSQQLRAALADFYVMLADDKAKYIEEIKQLLTIADSDGLEKDLVFLNALNLPPLPADYQTQSEAGQSADDKKVIEDLGDALLQGKDTAVISSLFDLLEQRTFAYKPLEDNRNKLLQLLN